jgi:hypothetical protein
VQPSVPNYKALYDPYTRGRQAFFLSNIPAVGAITATSAKRLLTFIREGRKDSLCVLAADLTTEKTQASNKVTFVVVSGDSVPQKLVYIQ